MTEPLSATCPFRSVPCQHSERWSSTTSDAKPGGDAPGKYGGGDNPVKPRGKRVPKARVTTFDGVAEDCIAARRQAWTHAKVDCSTSHCNAPSHPGVPARAPPTSIRHRVDVPRARDDGWANAKSRRNLGSDGSRSARGGLVWSQAKRIRAVADLRRIAKPIAPKPSIIIAQVAGSGTADVVTRSTDGVPFWRV